MSAVLNPGVSSLPRRLQKILMRAFVRLGVLSFMLVIAIVVFSFASDQFLSVQNLTNLLRQSVYLILVAMGQMLTMVTGGFDLSGGTVHRQPPSIPS